MTEISATREEKLGQYADLRESEDKIQSRQESVEQQVELIREELVKTNRLLDSRENEYNLTKSLVDNLEGFPEAIKFLNKSQQWKNAPLLSDIITCPEEYRVAIENFLEPSQHLSDLIEKVITNSYHEINCFLEDGIPRFLQYQSLSFNDSFANGS